MSVLVDRHGHALRITINRPDQRNAFNEGVIAGISDAITQAAQDATIRAIVLTGAGDRAFCAGADLTGTTFAVRSADPTHFLVQLFRQIEACHLPIIARVNGAALAGGLGLLCAADLAVSADHAMFGAPEAKVGIFPMMIMPYLLRILPPRHLMELCLTADPITASQAQAMGLVNHVVPMADLDARVASLVDAIAKNSPTAIRLGKRGLQAMRDMTIRQAWDFAETMVPVMSATADAQEGFAAFREKRRPAFPGT